MFDFYIDETNEVSGPVVRWRSNDRIPFEDKLQEFLGKGLIGKLELNNSVRQREIEDQAFLAEYARNKGPSAEERFEARAAMGPGVEMVNVITGHRWIS